MACALRTQGQLNAIVRGKTKLSWCLQATIQDNNVRISIREKDAVLVAGRCHCKLCWDSSNCYFVRWNCGRGSANGLTRAQNLPRRALASTCIFVWLEHIRLGVPASNNLRSHSFF